MAYATISSAGLNGTASEHAVTLNAGTGTGTGSATLKTKGLAWPAR